MCGIAIAIDPLRIAAEDCTARMVAVQEHRGPDGRGSSMHSHASGAWVGLGHSRLAIVGLGLESSQPMTSLNGQHTLVFNGEIYNYPELADELELHECNGCDRPGDTRVLVEAIARWGTDAIARLRGMWSFACFHHPTGRLMVSRDRFGIKPLYYWCDGTRLLMASEVKALLTAIRRPLPIDGKAAAKYLAYGLLDTDSMTFFEGIRAFPPAHVAEIDPARPGQIHAERYWSPPPAGTRSGTAADTDELRHRLRDSVRMHLRSDVPVGILLSGGIDSSAVLGLANDIDPAGRITAFSAVSDDPQLDESKFIDIMASHSGTRVAKVNVSANPMELFDAIDEASWANDQPLCALSDVAHLLLMRKARSLGLKVLLSGQGADEQFGGYNKFRYFYLRQLLRSGRVDRAGMLAVLTLLRTDAIRDFRLGEAVRYAGSRKLACAGMLRSGSVNYLDIDIGAASSYSQRERLDLDSLSLPALLHYEDRMSMWSSVEVRTPFLDHPVVELALSLGPASKFRGGRSKSILRDALTGLIPEEIRLRRDKRGFGIPEATWLRTVFRPSIEAMFAGQMLSDSLGIVDQAGAKRAFDAFLKGKPVPNGRQIMRLYLLERFIHRFAANIDGLGTAPRRVDHELS
jgi:asparagine synthase (glutamine-hydrolysing)